MKIKFKDANEVKQFLKKYHCKKMLAKSLLRQHDEMVALKNETGGVAAVKYDAAPKTKGKISDPVYKTYSQIDKLRNKYFKEMYIALKYLQICERLIRCTDDDEQIILRNFYFKKMSAEDISNELYISETTMFRKLNSGINKIYEKYKYGSE